MMSIMCLVIINMMAIDPSIALLVHQRSMEHNMIGVSFQHHLPRVLHPRTLHSLKVHLSAEPECHCDTLDVIPGVMW